MKQLVSLKNASLMGGGKVLLQGINLDIFSGECLLLRGKTGSGKTLLAETLAGKRLPARGDIHFYGRKEVALVSFDTSALMSGFRQMYYQKRFNDDEGFSVPRVSEYLHRFTETIELSAELLNLLHELLPEVLLHRAINQLSNGESKRLLVYLALLKEPKLLILDEPFTGLDAGTRTLMLEILQKLKASGVSLFIIDHSRVHVTFADRLLKLTEGRLSESLPGIVVEKDASGIRFTRELYLHSPLEKENTLVSMEHVRVDYGNKPVIRDLNWQIGSGENWVLSGPNGSGKSSLLSLITADHPQAYGQNIWLFGRKRGTGESIWDIKSKIAFMSPELQVYFPAAQESLKIIASGLYDTMGLYRRLESGDASKADQQMNEMGIAHLSSIPFRTLSTGEKRLVLLARTFIRQAPLLILDEPCQGIDQAHRTWFLKLVDDYLQVRNTSLIYVSHYREELPACMNFELVLPEEKTYALQAKQD